MRKHSNSTTPEPRRHNDQRSAGAPSIIVFDVNETLIDIESMGNFFEKIFGDRRVLREWFNQLILYSNVTTLAGYYETFFTLGMGIFEMLGTVYGVSHMPSDREELKTRMMSMPAHEDAEKGLRLLKQAGFRLVTLTNSPPGEAGSPLDRAGLTHFFERQFSVDQIRKFKPAPEVYHFVAESLNVPPSAICLVAAHTWDTFGAQAVGYSAGLVMRMGNAPLPIDGLPQPQVIAPDLELLARRMIAMWR